MQDSNLVDVKDRRAGLSYRFSHAIVRAPADSVVDGLRAVDRGPPSVQAFRAEHRAYIAALENAGLAVESLPALEAYPDSVFVEDPALCLPEGAIVLRPGAATRRGEAATLEPALRRYFDDVRRIEEGADIDGGDILVTDELVLVGLSARTSPAGFAALSTILSDWGYRAASVETPPESLHFKSDCALLDSETILACKHLAGHDCFKPFRTLLVPEGEEPAANVIRVNDKVLVSDRFPRTLELLTAAGYAVLPLSVGEAAKLDGGLSCMSLRFTPGG